MREPTPAMLLGMVRRRLRLLRWARALRGAAWTSAALLVSLALARVWLMPVDATFVVAVAAMPWLGAAGWAASQRITERECADWADRNLGGASAFSTWLEIAAGTPSSPAVERFRQWLAAVVPRGLATLRALPLRLRLTKPLSAMIVSALLAATVLQLPPPQSAGARAKPPVATSAAARDDEGDQQSDRDTAAADAASPAPRATAGKQAAANEESPAGDLRPLTQAADAGATEALELATAPAAGATGARAATGGRDAGDSPDTVQDSGLAPSWQGELARQLLSSPTAADDVSARADPARVGTYGTATRLRATEVATLGPAPAAAPAARSRARLGPAEQAYLRAYFAGSGATP